MRRIGKGLLLAFVLTCVLLSAGLFALQRWIGSDDFRTRVQAEASHALGKEVRLANLEVDIWPLPAVALNRVDIGTRPVLRLERVEVRPVLTALSAGRLELATLLLRRADASQAALDELLLSLRERAAPATTPAVATDGASGGGTRSAQGAERALMPRRVILDSLTWRSAGGATTLLDADAHLDTRGLPEKLVVSVLAGQWQGADLRLLRKERVWDVAVDVAGGSIRGQLTLQGGSPNADPLALDGQLQTRNVELGVLLRRPGRDGSARSGQSPMHGKLEAVTNLHAKASSLAAILGELRTDSWFIVRNAVVVGVDLARAVKSVGLSHGGETRLDTLSGQVLTRGKAIEVRDLVARSGALSASGNLAVAPSRSLSGKVEVSLGAKVVGRAVGVPLAVGGTLDAPELSLTRSAMVGAAIGSLLMPGVGTGAGVALGEKVGSELQKLFGK